MTGSALGATISAALPVLPIPATTMGKYTFFSGTSNRPVASRVWVLALSFHHSTVSPMATITLAGVNCAPSKRITTVVLADTDVTDTVSVVWDSFVAEIWVGVTGVNTMPRAITRLMVLCSRVWANMAISWGTGAAVGGKTNEERRK